MNDYHYLGVLILFLFPFILTAQNQDSESGDRAALQALYDATGGSGWDNRSNWGSSGDLGNWYGVETNSQGRVVRLNLADNNLRGELPAEIGNLSQLRYINIKQNRLTGEIPASIGNWRQIEWLLLSGRYARDPNTNPDNSQHAGKSDESGNNFSGVFPDVWANFQQLQYVEIAGSALERILYDSIGECTELLQIHMAWNVHLVGQEIPSTINNLTKLTYFDLSRGEPTGEFPDVSNMRELRYLILNRSAGGGNGLTGPFPDLSNNTMLREVHLDRNSFTGDWPHYWNSGNYVNRLVTIRATYNNMTGTLHGFENLNLRTFAISNNNLEGPIPESIVTNRQLIILNLSNNNFTGQIPQTGWDRWDRLRYLSFNNNNLTGPIPDRLPGWDIESPSDITGSQRWQNMLFRGNNLSGPVSTNHAHYLTSRIFDSFEYMDIRDNAFSESDYSALQDLMGSRLRAGNQDPDRADGSGSSDYEDDDNDSEGDEVGNENDSPGSADRNHLPVNSLETVMDQNYPNPFNPTTQIRFALSQSQQVSLSVYNMAGQRVAQLVNSTLNAGRHQVTFDAQGLSSGVYFYRLITNDQVITRKMMLIK
jgi:hypothetical protein